MQNHLMVKTSSCQTLSIQLLVVVAVILVAYFFGISGINQDPIRRDESTTMGHIGAMERDSSGMSLSETWDSLLTHSGEHPPMYYSMANIWGHIISYDYRIQRILSLLMGILALAVVYRLGADIASPSVGLWAITILATFTFYHHYLHEIREYATLLFSISFVWLIYMRCVSIKRQPTIWHYLGLGTMTSMAMFSHPTAMFLFIPIGLYHLFFVPKSRRWWYVSVAVVVGGLTFILWLPGLFSGIDTFNSRLAEGEDKTLYNHLLIPQVMQFWGNGEPIVFILIMGLSLFSAIRDESGSRRIWFFAVIVALGYLALNIYFPFIKRLRYVLVFTLPYILLAGLGMNLLGRLTRQQYAPLVLLALWIAVGSGFYQTSTFTDAMGTTAPKTFTEYHHLIPLLESVTEPNITMVNTVYSLATMKDSKQGKMGIDEYYQTQFGIQNYNIRVDVDGRQATENTVDFVSGESVFWLNYFRNAELAQVRDFKEAIANDFQVCKEYIYGERSILIQYVAIDIFDTTCNHQ